MKIETLTHHGLGRASDGSLWPRTLPGEEIDSEGRIVTPSEQRVSAPCSHFKSCGGCSVQHASDAFVAQWKSGIVRQALAARGIEAPLRKIHVSPPRSRRRAKFSARRSKKAAMIGFHGRNSDTIVPIRDCHLIAPSLQEALPQLEALAMIAASRKSELGLTVTQSKDGLDVAVQGAKPLEDLDWSTYSDWAQQADIARLSVNGESIVTRRMPIQGFGPARVTPPSGAFLQATQHGEAALLRCVQEGLSGCSHVVDLFSGSGTFSLPLAVGADVDAYESDKAAIDALDAGWRTATGIHQVRARARDLFRAPLLDDELSQYDGAVIDPPRAGAAAQVKELAQSGPAKIVYVSCNPITFARDAEKLLERYDLQWVDVVDQFRWSPHVELAALFTAK